MGSRAFTFMYGLSAAFATFCTASPVRADWRATGPFGGDSELVRVVPSVKNLVVAGSHNALLFVSTNGGAFWNPIHFPAQLASTLHALEVDPDSASTWYAGVESDSNWLAGVWKTTDSGKTWTVLADTRGLQVWSLRIFPGDSKVIAAGTGSGVFQTNDAGASWKRISPDGDPELRPVVSLAYHPTNKQILYAGTTHLPWRTTNGGHSWSSIHQGMLDDSDVFSIQVDPLNPSRVFASACSGVYASVDEAGKWSKLNTPPGAFRTYFVAMDPKNTETVFAGTTEGLLRSTTSGRAWVKVSPLAVRSVAFDPFVSGRLFFASSGGMLVSTDGGVTIRESNFGFTNRSFTTVTGAGTQLYTSSVYESVTGGIYSTANLGLRWTRAGEPKSDQVLAVAASPENPNVILAAGYRSLSKSVDGGKTWVSAFGPSGKISALVALPGGLTLAATDAGIFRGADGAWAQASPFVAATLSLSGTIPVALSVSEAWFSPDGGQQWNRCGQPTNGAAWYGLAFDAAGTVGTAIAATSAGVFRSTNGCSSWSAVSDGLRNETASLAVFHPTRAGEVFISQGGRVFRSTDGGIRWAPLDDDSGATFGPSSLYMLPSAPDRLFGLFPRRGVFSITILTKERTLQ